MRKTYENREFCRSIDCGKQGRLDDPDITEARRNSVLSDCDKCTANRFHQYLKDQGYEIVKEIPNQLTPSQTTRIPNPSSCGTECGN